MTTGQDGWIEVKGARTHNLKDISVNLPKGKFVVISGVSGSGKSSLAFDTLYAEGQRRYVESLSSYARQFIGQMKKAESGNHTAQHAAKRWRDAPFRRSWTTSFGAWKRTVLPYGHPSCALGKAPTWNSSDNW